MNWKKGECLSLVSNYVIFGHPICWNNTTVSNNTVDIQSECGDINECDLPNEIELLDETELFHCHGDASCIQPDTNGSYVCECNPAFIGNGKNCSLRIVTGSFS